jgi:3-oxoacyl-[acyl-carrier-protein] synthase-1
MRACEPVDYGRVPLLLCVAETGRGGRLAGLDEQLLPDVERELQVQFSTDSGVIAGGRAGAAIAILRARALILGAGAPGAIVAGADSLICWPTLAALERESRLLTSDNSNGFIPGEAGCAVFLGPPPKGPRLLLDGIGLANEAAHIQSGLPLRADGLCQAIRAALADAGCELHELDFRITDLAGEQYYFKEAALALARALRQRKEQFDLWHPAQFMGETGSAIGPALLAVADMACRKGYAAGPNILCHLSNDSGERAAIVARYRAH